MPKARPEAVQQAVRLLAQREHSGQELRHKLRARGHSSEAADAALATLREQGLQSDERFAQACADSLMARGYGSIRVAHELRERGVAAALVETFEAQARAGDPDRAASALGRKSGGTREQMLRFLGQRGYPGEVARRAVEAALAGASDA